MERYLREAVDLLKQRDFTRAGDAILYAGVIDIIRSIAVDLVVRMTGQFVALRAEINLLFASKEKSEALNRLGLASGRCLPWMPSWKRS